MEVDWVHDSGRTFKNDRQSLGRHKPFKAERINNLYAMNVKCFVEETMDVSDANTYFEWKVNNYLMEKWKNAIYHDAFFSPTFNAIGGEWHIRIYPNAAANGWSTQGEAELDIVCQSIESEEKEINICDYIEIKPLNHYQIHFDGNSVKKGESVTCNSPFKWNDIKNESQITIGIKIWR
eukprot:492444_1